ncbi:MAG TPA: winged helix-turn-helix domain-containing protein [Nitrososphaeraceae archaeon]|nr:winged helix-turn-helix domain-containing protein [Nitrososphaeraceae archaeon]
MTYRARTRTEIMSQILRVANGGGATQTKIMYQTFLSYGQTKEYLMALTQKGLLNYDLDSRIFKTTEKGRKFLEAYNLLVGVIKEQKQQV